MSERELRFRQVHLDFHTSPDIENVGADFDSDEFASTLARAHVNSVTCFARCHHGHIYFDTKKHPERIHPQLARRNLLAEQIEACHERGIRVPIYTTIQWDAYTADRHRDWLMIDEEGKEYGTAPLAPGFYRYLDVLHPGYRQFLRNHLQDILETLPVDGLFLDIVQPQWSAARHWLDAMDNAGLDPEDASARERFARKVLSEWKLETTDFIRQFNTDCTVFYNAGHVGPGHRPTIDAYTHYELESLPSGGWGYMHFPQTMRYARTLGRDCLGMTGKFHTSWGDFHSFKNEAALQFECFNMLALGAKCSVGDQLHPSGRIDPHTYDLIGKVYAEVEAKEPWCVCAKAVSEVGVFTPEAFPGKDAGPGRDLPAAMGAVRMLQELCAQFDLVDAERDLAAYKLLVLPDEIPVDEALEAKLKAHVAAGGALIASCRSGLKPGGDARSQGARQEVRTGAFASDLFGVELKGDAPFSPDFIVPGEKLGPDLPPTGHVMYLRGLEVEAGDGAEVLADVEIPYFNRTWRHYCPHAHTPSSGRVAYPGVVRKGSCIYFAHPVFTQYNQNAPLWCKKLVAAAVDLLLPRKLVEVEAPSSMLAALNHQPDRKRYVLHLQHYIPERRGQRFDVIEDVIPVHDVRVSVVVPGKAEAVLLVPAGEAIDFEQVDGRVGFTVPKVDGHCMVEITLG
jgi:hypothetical protein